MSSNIAKDEENEDILVDTNKPIDKFILKKEDDESEISSSVSSNEEEKTNNIPSNNIDQNEPINNIQNAILNIQNNDYNHLISLLNLKQKITFGQYVYVLRTYASINYIDDSLWAVLCSTDVTGFVFHTNIPIQWKVKSHVSTPPVFSNDVIGLSTPENMHQTERLILLSKQDSLDRLHYILNFYVWRRIVFSQSQNPSVLDIIPDQDMKVIMSDFAILPEFFVNMKFDLSSVPCTCSKSLHFVDALYLLGIPQKVYKSLVNEDPFLLLESDKLDGKLFLHRIEVVDNSKSCCMYSFCPVTSKILTNISGCCWRECAVCE